MLLNGNSKPLFDLKTYHHITLLPILRKVLEKVVLSCALYLYRNISDAQHDFTRVRSTVTAHNSINAIADCSLDKYVQLFFMDISGAFDNDWSSPRYPNGEFAPG